MKCVYTGGGSQPGTYGPMYQINYDEGWPAEDNPMMFAASGSGLFLGTRGIITSGSFYMDVEVPGKTFEFRDHQGNHLYAVDMEFYRAPAGDPLSFEQLGSFTTDWYGEFDLTREENGDVLFVDEDYVTHTLEEGDRLKFRRFVVKQPAAKKSDWIAFTVHMDNAEFSETGEISFAELDAEAEQQIVVDHAEFGFNLNVSVEWRCTVDYTFGLVEDIRSMSAYLFDVFDGQARIDTVRIFSGKENWDLADIQILASNKHLPLALTNGYQLANDSRAHITMPRKFYIEPYLDSYPGTQEVVTLDLIRKVYNNNPNANSVPENFRAMAHELGHYFIGFEDEYKPVGSISQMCLALGFMYSVIPMANVASSEMSNACIYDDFQGCMNTEQYVAAGPDDAHGSCWDWFEERWEGDFGSSGALVSVPVTKPEERDDGIDLDCFMSGPDADLDAYGIKDKVEFLLYTQAPADPVVRVRVYDMLTNASISGAEVKMLGSGLIPSIEQGETYTCKEPCLPLETAKNGYLYALGAYPGCGFESHSGLVVEDPQATRTIRNLVSDFHWQYGLGVYGTTELRLNRDIDITYSNRGDVEIALREVIGHYPLLCSLAVCGGDPVFRMTGIDGFSELPSLVHGQFDGAGVDFQIASSPATYQATIAEPLGSQGEITIWARDDENAEYYFPTSYRKTVIAEGQTSAEIADLSGRCLVEIDSLTTAGDVVLLTSSYPIPASGLEEHSQQGGDTYSLTACPEDLLSVATLLTIAYDERDLETGFEELTGEHMLRMFRWDEGTLQWSQVGGHVDTLSNRVIARVDQAGTYAAFTTSDLVPTDVPGLTPAAFSLGQCRPNPFNPSTSIDYEIPAPCMVTVSVYSLDGRRVAVLVDDAMPAGRFTTSWDGRDLQGRQVAAGVYFYRLKAGEMVLTKRMLLLK